MKMNNYLTAFRGSLFKLSNCENGRFDLVRDPIEYCPSYFSKINKKKDKGLNREMISLNISTIQGFAYI